MEAVIKDQKEFESIIQAHNLSVIHFQADWAEQCSQVNELLETLSSQKKYPETKFYSCPAEDLSEVCLKYKIEAVPTVILFRSGSIVETVHGADPSKIIEAITKYSALSGDGGDSVDKNKSLDARLKMLINKSKIMLFMKGDRNNPRCGFSRKTFGVPYETFDILSDEDVRQGLKTYSNWPTYPQLYVAGELIGGLDIIKEMLDSGELGPTLRS
nr:glutaredoxin 3 [Leptinotarsa decemlineata]